MRFPLLSVAFGLVALVGAGQLGIRLAAQALSRPYDVGHVPLGPAARVAALGHRTFLSDLYWLSAVQYIGEPRADQRGFDKLYPLVDLVTDLDPRHGYAYQTAGIVLSAAGRLDESDRILRKGVERGPPYWTFPYYLAFNAWFYRGDYAEGAHWADVAARTPGASANISHLALALSSKSGVPEAAIAMLLELRGTVKDEATAQRLDEQLKLATLERDAQALERAIARFEEKERRPIRSLQELVWNGVLDAIPPDPFGGHYEWHSADRQVRSSANPFRFTVRESGQAPAFQWHPKPTDLEKMPR